MNWKIFDSRDLFLNDVKSFERHSKTISPYNIPQAYRVFLDNNRNTLYLEFRYIAPDAEIIVKDIVSGVKIGCGVDSKRIFMVSFDLSLVSDAGDLSRKFEQLRIELEGKERTSNSSARIFGDRAVVSRKTDLIQELE
jgi:hypothetical protein